MTMTTTRPTTEMMKNISHVIERDVYALKFVVKPAKPGKRDEKSLKQCMYGY